MNFHDYITLLMQEKNIGVNELAERTGISAGHISRITRGLRAIPKATTIKKLAAALDADPNTLLVLAGYIEPEQSGKRENEIYDIEEF